jgi:hypothetical protein
MPVDTAYRKSQVRAIYGNEPLSTFHHRIKNHQIPPPDFYMGDTPLWWQSTIERDQQAKRTIGNVDQPAGGKRRGGGNRRERGED